MQPQRPVTPAAGHTAVFSPDARTGARGKKPAGRCKRRMLNMTVPGQGRRFFLGGKGRGQEKSIMTPRGSCSPRFHAAVTQGPETH